MVGIECNEESEMGQKIAAVAKALSEEGQSAQEALDRQLLALACDSWVGGRLVFAHEAIAKGKELLRRGARPSGARNAAGRDALLGALLSGMEELSLALLEAGAKVDLRDENGHNALAIAAFNGNARAVEMILDRCPASELSNIGPQGVDAWVLVAGRCPGARGLAALIPEHPEQCDLNESLMLAVGAKNDECASAATAMLLRLGANPNARRQGKMAYGAMQEALLFGNEGAAENLLAAGADPLEVHANGDTAISIAARRGLAKSLRMLAHIGELDSRDCRGYTPLMEALENQESQLDEDALPFLLSVSDFTMLAFSEPGLNGEQLSLRAFAEKYGTPEGVRLLDLECARRESREIGAIVPKPEKQAQPAKRI